MNIKVRIVWTGEVDELEIEPNTTLKRFLDQISDRYRFNISGSDIDEMDSFLQVQVNGQDYMKLPKMLNTALNDGDYVEIAGMRVIGGG